ncbi:MAG: SAM-dependent methyltransferase [Melioribacteraceae bacterium]|nr:SAM-dependent methyltransferase [Melioribacteraceae bacterium]
MILEKEYKKQTSISHRKKYAQFFTPEPVAQIMVDWILDTPKLQTLLEPAFGLGVFSRLVLERKGNINITSFDVDPIIFDIAKQNFESFSNINYFLEDYLFNDWDNKYDTIICNPPYFKFHDYENKKTLEEIKNRLRINLSGFTNVYTLFLLKSIFQLNENGRAAYIIPSEFLNSDYGKLVKEYLLKSKALRHIIIFDFKENIFDDALTTSAIVLLQKNNTSQKVSFSNINNLSELKAFPNIPKIEFETKILNPDIKWRKYYQEQKSERYKDLIPFKNVTKVVRGIATGANEYFTFNQSKANKYKVINECLLACITKSKDVTSPFFTNDDFEKLKNEDANIYLIDACKKQNEENIRKYIKLGEHEEIDKKYLTSKRTPWYSLENRPPSPIWVGVFNRNGMKFIRNEANISNLTTFHCIYPNSNLFYKINIDLLFAYLLTDVAKQIFSDNRREYGDGLKKFEPNDLNNALMLDLSKLDNETENEIINLYTDYRNSVVNKKPDEKYIEEINKILIRIYEA